MKNTTNDRLIELLTVSRVPEQLSESERTELNELLRDNEENQLIASQFLMDGETLAELLKVSDIAEISSGRPTIRMTRVKPNRSWGWVWGICAAAACAVLVGVPLLIKERGPVAKIEDRVDARFEREIPGDGVLASKQPYHLLDGMATVRFRNGVLATIKAPAQFEIVDAFNVELTSGVIRANVPDSGLGFTIRTPTADVEDLGTEFGVSVDAASGESEVFVFDGLVHVNSTNGGNLLKALAEGESTRVDSKERLTAATETADAYPAPRDISYLRWLRIVDTIQQDPDVLCYYTFQKETPELADASAGGTAINGAIMGPKWVSGRWPDKRALLFDNLGDRVKVDLPGEYAALGFSAWIYITDIDGAIAPIMNSVGWEPGVVHIQLNHNDKGFYAGVNPSRTKDLYQAPLVETGRWIHLAASVDTVNRRTTTWVNGKMASDRVLGPNVRLTPGTCYLGDWLPHDPVHMGRRSFKGRMDEVLIMRRALSALEVNELYNAGRPIVHVE